ncbi:PASTA domain-containing protein [Streptomyces sp. NPDC086082]|uniref:PASTA domain-containing protein n=1 Tax=Streptomyces sp. NPDC086082 TaxID=3365750 RepID=UPI00382B3EED
MREVSKSARLRVAAGAVAGLRRWVACSPRAVVLVVAVLVAGAFAVTPAYADDPGLNCAVTADVLVLSGPGLTPSTAVFPVGGGSQSVFISGTGTLGWGVTVVDTSSDTGYSRGLASTSASVTGVTTVPRVLGDTQTQAGQALSAAGYVLGSVNTVVDCDSISRVTSQNPGAGTVLLPGSPVSITLGRKPTPPAQCP